MSTSTSYLSANWHRPASCTVCGVPLVSDHPLRQEGVCSVEHLEADAPRRARYQDPNWRP